MRKGASTRTRRCAIKAIVWMVYRMNNQAHCSKRIRQLRDCLYEPCLGPSHPLESVSIQHEDLLPMQQRLT
jgi:hypothetical protein